METKSEVAYKVRFNKKVTREVGGILGTRIITIPEYYGGKGRRVPNEIDAATMSKELAEQICDLYHRENPEMLETRFFDRVKGTLVQVGEAPDVIRPPEILDQLENLLRRCLDQGITRRQLFDVTSKVAFVDVK